MIPERNTLIFLYTKYKHVDCSMLYDYMEDDVFGSSKTICHINKAAQKDNEYISNDFSKINLVTFQLFSSL